jgi:hypothetical protein
MAAETESSGEARGLESPGKDVDANREEHAMSKGMERKKEGKKKPTKTLEEKRAAKKAKRESRG